MSQRIPQKPKRRTADFRRGPCGDVFTCRACGWPVGPADAAPSTATTVPTVYPASIWTTSLGIAPPTAVG